MSKVTKSGQALTRAGSKTQEDANLTSEEMRRLLTIAVELVGICARVSGRIDPAIGTMIAFARDELLRQ